MHPCLLGVCFGLPDEAKSDTFGWWTGSANQRRAAFVDEDFMIPPIVYNSNVPNPQYGHTVLILSILLGKLRDLVGRANVEKSRAQTDLYPNAH